MEDLRTSETWRVFRIQSELIDGIESLHNLGAAVSIFGSSRLREDSPFYQAAQRVARTLADAGLSVITGGGPGVMEAANRGAFGGLGHSGHVERVHFARVGTLNPVAHFVEVAKPAQGEQFSH